MKDKGETKKRLLMEFSEEVVHCPSCDASLKPYEVAKHCEEELAQLNQLNNKISLANGEDVITVGGACVSQNESTESRKPWSVFRKVQKNRQTRLKLRSRKRPLAEQTCPVCSKNFPQDEIQRHAEQCLRQTKRMNGGSHLTGDNDDEDESDDGEYEEYEWAGQKRIRASSLLQGGYAALGVGTVVTNHSAEDDEEDLNVDEDDTQIYGPAQYAESDVIPPTIDTTGQNHEEENLASYMRHLIAGGNTTNESSQPSPPAELLNNSNHLDNLQLLEKDKNRIEQNSTAPSQVQYNYLQVIESLKSKLRHYENHVQNKFKCLICLDEYRNPAISVCCWHVHCEECWLRSLGARKLCPQCNLITSPKDLRRIYM